MQIKRSLKPDAWPEGSNFSTNDYLGLATHPSLISVAQEALSRYGMGSTGSRLLSGDYDGFHDLERSLSAFLQTESALVFNSGYQMNAGILSALFGTKDLILADKLVHASLVDGALASSARFKRYRHLDYKHLISLLEKYRDSFDRVVIVSESLFSMDGDCADLEKLVEIKHQFNVQLMIDDAHGFGICGSQGRGLSAIVSPSIDFILGTFGKACGSAGAFIGCSQAHKDILINRCRSLIYSTSLPHPVISWNKAVLDLLPSLDEARSRVSDLSRLLRTLLASSPYPVLGEHHIIPVVTKEYSDTLSQKCREAGFLTYPIHPPTVPEAQSRLRFSITAKHDQHQIESLAQTLL